MKKKLNLKIEEVKINKNLQSSGMYGGACGGGGVTGIGSNGSNPVASGDPTSNGFGSTTTGNSSGSTTTGNSSGRNFPIAHVVDSLDDLSIMVPQSKGWNAVIDGVFGAPISALWGGHNTGSNSGYSNPFGDNP